MTKKIKLGILGARGKMGRQLCALLKDSQYGSRFKLVYKAPRLGKNEKYTFTKHNKPHVLIDFSRPEATLKMAALCGLEKVKMLICTTGFNQIQMKKISKLMKKTKWQYASNTSQGVALSHKLVALLGRDIGDQYSVILEETHHRHKKDSPSGTAKALSETYKKSNGSKNPLKIKSYRKGEVIGIHRFTISGPAERIIIEHKAEKRSLFAHGALEMARKLA